MFLHQFDVVTARIGLTQLDSPLSAILVAQTLRHDPVQFGKKGVPD